MVSIKLTRAQLIELGAVGNEKKKDQWFEIQDTNLQGGTTIVLTSQRFDDILISATGKRIEL